MTKLNLKFTARDIALIEDMLDCSLEKAIAGFRLSTLVKFIEVGLRDKSGNHMNLDEDKAYDFVDKAIKEQGKIELQIQILDSLIEAGFLPKAVNTTEMREALSETVASASKTVGEITK